MMRNLAGNTTCIKDSYSSLNASIAGQYDVSYTKKAKTCFLLYQPRHDGGHMDVWGELADGTNLWTCRVSTARDTQTNYILYGAGVQSFAAVVCVCSGYETATKLWFYPHQNVNCICGLGWTNEETSTFSGAWVHRDNVVGNLSSFSDERIKGNVSGFDPSIA